MLAIAFTGGPGFGKSTTLGALERRGHKCVAESARAIIRERIRLGLAKRPPAHEFAAQVLRLDQDQYQRVRDIQGLVFFDRGVIDALGMCFELGLHGADELADALRDYPFHSTAFVFPPWREIYATDAERDQSFEEALAVDAAVRRWYRRCGIDLIDVPRLDVQARCDFILGQLPSS